MYLAVNLSLGVSFWTIATLDGANESLKLCQRLDLRMKSEKGVDDEGELKLLLMRLAQKPV